MKFGNYFGDTDAKCYLGGSNKFDDVNGVNTGARPKALSADK